MKMHSVPLSVGILLRVKFLACRKLITSLSISCASHLKHSSTCMLQEGHWSRDCPSGPSSGAVYGSGGGRGGGGGYTTGYVQGCRGYGIEGGGYGAGSGERPAGGGGGSGECYKCGKVIRTDLHFCIALRFNEISCWAMYCVAVEWVFPREQMLPCRRMKIPGKRTARFRVILHS